MGTGWIQAKDHMMICLNQTFQEFGGTNSNTQLGFQVRVAEGIPYQGTSCIVNSGWMDHVNL